MTEGESLDDYGVGVHRSLQEKYVMFGIGSTAFYVILMVTVFLVSFIGLPCIIFGVLALWICRMVCKKEPMLLEFMFKNLGMKDYYRG